jgi:uncharacterized glyoxalase superfamily protein PhnB
MNGWPSPTSTPGRFGCRLRTGSTRPASSIQATRSAHLTSDEAGVLEAAFDNLAVGSDAGPLDPLTVMPFGVYGHLRDAYGVHWFFRADRAREGA